MLEQLKEIFLATSDSELDDLVVLVLQRAAAENQCKDASDAAKKLAGAKRNKNQLTRLKVIEQLTAELDPTGASASKFQATTFSCHLGKSASNMKGVAISERRASSQSGTIEQQLVESNCACANELTWKMKSAAHNPWKEMQADSSSKMNVKATAATCNPRKEPCTGSSQAGPIAPSDHEKESDGEEIWLTLSKLMGKSNMTNNKLLSFITTMYGNMPTLQRQDVELETFKNHLDPAKENENDDIIINNTSHPEERSPQFTKNKLGSKASVAVKINDNVVSGEDSKQTKANNKKKKAALQEQLNEEEKLSEMKLDSFEKEIHVFSKKKTSILQADALHQKRDSNIKGALNGVRDISELDEEEQLIQAYEQQVAEEEANAIKKKIKKKLKEQMSEFTSSVQSHEMVLNNEISKKKKKKKVPVLSAAETSAMTLSELQSGPEEENSSKKRSLERPLISKSTEDALTEETQQEGDVEKPKFKGKKAKRKSKKALEEDKEQAVENASHVASSVSPEPKPIFDDSLVLGVYIHRTDRLKTDLMVSHPMVKIHVIDQKTGLYVKKENRKFKSTLPEWEEQIIFNERFNYFLQDAEESPRVILFFEILDFLSMNDAKANFDGQARESGFRKICWAFLKLVGANGVLNVGGKLRLQLYSPPARIRSQLNVVEVYDWWAKCPRNHYPSTLYVTIKGIKLPEHVCRIPNKYLFSLRAGDMGCFCIRFSEDGRTLAAGCVERNGYPILLYEIPSGQYLQEFYGHLNIVYDLCWSKDNQHLLTASSDGTARMWKIEIQTSSAMKVFPHPSFVYAAKYHPTAEYIIVTGCYDAVIRVWNAKVKEIHGHLLQEFDGHRGFINTLCFDAEGFHMFTGDSTGLIIVWNTYVKEDSQSPTQHWGIDKEIKDDDIKGTAVNHLEVHPNGRRLLIHAKDSAVRIMDLRILAMKKYIGATNYREKIRSTLTPCGTFLFSGSEDGKAYVWNAETGDQVAMYSDISFTSALRDVAFHPHEHMVSFCAYGQNQPILVYIYDYKVAQQDAKLVKDFNGLHLSTSSRGPQILSNSAQKDTINSPADQFASVARVSMRMQKVKQKLDSVTGNVNIHMHQKFGKISNQFFRLFPYTN
ncbi:hypothetical protein JD844_024520 [Phrynosoma platyrhinos]|uniref:Jouberin n=1 Tax=Phrynosoma platyrhinos TaxID=52577 RepID=A0ABQ7SY81_PHRPL|nr:hypothetical protein JD844_024520 [Phrynosoma platyrhinos]